MKFAMCLSGQPRIRQETLENHKIFINDQFEHFIHCWWDESHRGKTLMFHSTEKIPNEDVLKQYVDSYGPTKFLAEDHKDFDLTFCKSHDYVTWDDVTQNHLDIFTPSLLYSFLSQAYSVKESVKMAAESADYKFLIRTRPDVIYTKDLTSFFQSHEPKDDEIYFQSSMEGGHKYSGEFSNNPCDWFFCGNKKAMLAFVNEWEPTIKDTHSTGVKHCRDTMREVARRAGLKLFLCDFGVVVYRQLIQNTHFREPQKYYDEFDFELLQVVKNHNEWPHWYKYIDFQFLKRREN